MRTNNSKGFALFELIAVLVLIALVVLIGLKVYNGKGSTVSNESSSTGTTTKSTLKSDVPTAPTITNTSDLDKSQKALDDTNIDENSADSAQLDKDTADF